jgi:hypothetical protein
MGVFMIEGELHIGFFYHDTLVDKSGEVYEGPLRLVLPLGGSFEYRHGGEHEEGYSYTTTKFTFEENDEGDFVLYREWYTESRDCDGRLDRQGTDYAEELDGNWHYDDPDVKYPLWAKVPKSYRQRDYAAEAMGY